MEKNENLIDNRLAEKIEVWGFEKNCIIYSDGSLGAAFKLSPLDVSCLSDSGLNEIKNRCSNFLNALPSGIRIQLAQDITTGNEDIIGAHLDTLSEDAPEMTKELTIERWKLLSDLDASGRIPRQKLYLFVRAPVENIMHIKKGWFFKRDKAELAEYLNSILDKEISIFESKLSNLERGLSGASIGFERMISGDIFDLIYRQWNPDLPISAPELKNIEESDIRSHVVMTDVVQSINGFSMGSFHHRVISLKNIPEFTFAAMAEHLNSLPIDSSLMLSIEATDHQKEIDALKFQRKIAYSMVAGAQSGLKDIESLAKLSEIDQLLAEMVTGNQKVFRAAMNVVIKSPDLSELDEQVSMTLQKIRELSGAEAMVESIAAFDIFCGIVYPHAKPKERTRRLNTSVLADFLPIYGLWRGHKIPRVILRNTNNNILGFDPFDSNLSNFNQIISGSSGTGKSFLTNLLLNQMSKENPKVFIIDIGASYQKMTNTLGGQYIPLGMQSGFSINPFDLTGVDSENLDLKIKLLVNLVELMTKEDNEKSLGKLERAELEKEISAVYKSETNPRLSHLQSKLLKHQDPLLLRIGKILSTWCGDAPFAKFVDRETSVSLDRNLVCFDLKGLDQNPDLQAVCLFLITDLVWREIQRDRTKQKIVVFDEAWKLLESESACQFISEVYRTFRKYQASPIAISQAMADFAKSRIASAILPNSTTKWILKQRGSGLEQLKETLQLNENEIAIIGSLHSQKGQYSEAFLMCDDKRQVVRIEATPLEYWLSTTDPLDLKKLQEIQSKNQELEFIDQLKIAAKQYQKGSSIQME
jgi:type-IV secretion system protein TraC